MSLILDLPLQDHDSDNAIHDALDNEVGQITGGLSDTDFTCLGPGGSLSRGIQTYKGLDSWTAIDAHLELSLPITLTGEFTVSVWLRLLTSDTYSGSIVGSYDITSMLLVFPSGGISKNLSVIVPSNTLGNCIATIENFVPDSDWHHYFITRDSDGHVHLRVDAGSEISATIYTEDGNAATACNGTFTIGQIGEGDEGTWSSGALSGLRIYSHKADLATAQADYERGLPRNYLLLDVQCQETAGDPIDSGPLGTTLGFDGADASAYTSYGPGGQLIRSFDSGGAAWTNAGEEINIQSGAVALAGEFTITWWGAVNGSNSIGYICSNEDYSQGISGDGSYIKLTSLLGVSDVQFTLAPEVANNEFHHYCVMRNSDNKIRLRIDMGPELIPDIDTAQSGEFVVANLAFGDEGNWSGRFCGFRVYSTKLGLSDIQADYERGLPRNYLLLDLPLQDDSEAGTVTDLSPLGYEVFLDNSPPTSLVSTTGPGGRYPKAFDVHELAWNPLVGSRIVGVPESALPIIFKPEDVSITFECFFAFSRTLNNDAVVLWTENVYSDIPATLKIVSGNFQAFIRLPVEGGDPEVFDLDLGVADTQWHHVALVLQCSSDGGQVKAYLDGVLTATSDPEAGRSSGIILMSRLLDDITVYAQSDLHVRVCGIKVYAQERTQQQIMANYRLVFGSASPMQAIVMLMLK